MAIKKFVKNFEREELIEYAKKNKEGSKSIESSILNNNHRCVTNNKVYSIG